MRLPVLAAVLPLVLTGCGGLGVTADVTGHPARTLARHVESYNAVNAGATEDMRTPVLVGTEFGVTAGGVLSLSRGTFRGNTDPTPDSGTLRGLDVASRDLTFGLLLPVWASSGRDMTEKIFAPVVVWLGVASSLRETEVRVGPAGDPDARTFAGSEATLRPLAAVTVRPRAGLPLALRAEAGFDLALTSDPLTVTSPVLGVGPFLAREYTAARQNGTSDTEAAIVAGLPGLHARVGLTLELPVPRR